MNIVLKEDKFHIRAFFAPCSCSCKFCCLGEYSKEKRITFEEYEEVMKKCSLISEKYGMRLRSFIYNCPEHPYIKRQIQLYDSLPMERSEYTQLDLNGTKIKTEDEIVEWFDMLQDAGVEKVAFSWFGKEKTHDDFVHRKDYFSYLNQCAFEAKKRGMPVISKVFLHKAILSELDELIDYLNQFSDTIICAFMEYSGNAKKMEKEFITIDDYKVLSNKVKKHFGTEYLGKFKTEKEWIEIANAGNFPKFNIVDYVLYVDGENVNEILKSSDYDIIHKFRNMNTSFQNSFGDIKELAEKYGDNNCLVLYECRDILRKWLDMHFDNERLDTIQLFGFTHSCVEWKVYERL